MINTMILFSILFSSCILQISKPDVSYIQNSPIEILQGIWEMEGEVEAYMIFENRINYSIVVLDGNVIVRKRFFGFFDPNSISGDSLDLRDLADDGPYFTIFTSKYEHGRFVYDRYSDFDEYSYDLDEDYFIYYANNPVTLNKIDALPKDIKKVFDKKKAELGHIKFIEDR